MLNGLEDWLCCVASYSAASCAFSLTFFRFLLPNLLQDCETCGRAVAGWKSGGDSGKGQQSRVLARDLQYCGGCGALCHSSCMQRTAEGGEGGDGGGGTLHCTLCQEGLTDVEAVLGCRVVAELQGGGLHGQQYYVKFKGKSYRCGVRWEFRLV